MRTISNEVNFVILCAILAVLILILGKNRLPCNLHRIIGDIYKYWRNKIDDGQARLVMHVDLSRKLLLYKI